MNTQQNKQQDISKLKMQLPDKIFKKKVNAYKTTPKIIDLNRKILSAGTDYDKKVIYEYEYVPTIEGGDSVGTVGEEVGEKDIVQPGTVIKVTVTGTGNYTGKIVGFYRVSATSIGNVKISIEPQEYKSTGVKITKKDITITYKNEPVSEEEYEIIDEYTNNDKKGNATVIIQGKGRFGGTKKVKFRIFAAEM